MKAAMVGAKKPARPARGKTAAASWRQAYRQTLSRSQGVRYARLAEVLRDLRRRSLLYPPGARQARLLATQQAIEHVLKKRFERHLREQRRLLAEGHGPALEKAARLHHLTVASRRWRALMRRARKDPDLQLAVLEAFDLARQGASAQELTRAVPVLSLQEAGLLQEITETEKERARLAGVLRRLLAGASFGEIAREMGVSEKEARRMARRTARAQTLQRVLARATAQERRPPETDPQALDRLFLREKQRYARAPLTELEKDAGRLIKALAGARGEAANPLLVQLNALQTAAEDRLAAAQTFLHTLPERERARARQEARRLQALCQQIQAAKKERERRARKEDRPS